jgi:hypothetical protein
LARVVWAALPQSAQARAQVALRNHRWANAREPARQQWIGSAGDVALALADAMEPPARATVPREDARVLLVHAEADATQQPLGAMQAPVRAKAAEADARLAAATRRGPGSRLP